MCWEVSNRVELQAKVVTNEEFEEAIRAVTEHLSKKRGISRENDSDTGSSRSQSHQSKKRKTVRVVEIEDSGDQMSEFIKASDLFKQHAENSGADKSGPESSTMPKPSGAKNGQQPAKSSESSVQKPKILEQTRRIADLAANLVTAEQRVEDYKREKVSADRRWKSQNGQLKAAEQDARELRRANPNVADYMRARNEAEHKMKSQYGELKKAKEKIADLESELRVEKGRTIRLEASLAMAGVQARGEKTVEVGSESHK